MPASRYSRYYKLDTLDDERGLCLSQRPNDEKSSEEPSLLHQIVGRETLEQLAKQYYGREDLWWRIADANPSKFPLDWKAGDIVIIPSLGRATRTPRT